MIDLKGYRINSIQFENQVPSGTELKLANQVKYNVNYRENSNICVGMLDFTVSDADMKPFEIRVQMMAEFSFDNSDSKEDIHVISFDQIFPFLRQTINNITATSGMPGLLIPLIKLKKENVQHGSMPKNVSDDDGVLN